MDHLSGAAQVILEFHSTTLQPGALARLSDSAARSSAIVSALGFVATKPLAPVK